MNDQSKEQIVMPVCPYCKVEMEPYFFMGYYDEFSMWGCDCDKIPDAKVIRGAYA